jgi:hypothetical protein
MSFGATNVQSKSEPRERSGYNSNYRAPRKGIQAKAAVAAITAPNPQKRKTEEGEWTKREGEKGVSYKRLIGAGGYGEIHEVLPWNRKLSDLL